MKANGKSSSLGFKKKPYLPKPQMAGLATANKVLGKVGPTIQSLNVKEHSNLDHVLFINETELPFMSAQQSQKLLKY